MTTKRFPPGPRGHFLLGSLPEVRADPLEFLTSCARDYGDIVHYRIFNQHVYLLNDPDYIEAVVSVHSRDFVKGRVYRAGRQPFGDGLLTSEGDRWQSHRRMIQPAFHRESLAACGDTITQLSGQALAGWRDGGTYDICEEMKQLSLQIVATVLFSTDISPQTDEIRSALRIVWEQFTGRVNAGLLLPEGVPTPGNIRFRRAINRLDGILAHIIQDHRASDKNGGDLMDSLLMARDENGSPMDDRQLLDEVKTLIIAGHETTALALSWAFYLLSGHPRVETRLREELGAALDGRPPTVEDLPRLPYTEMVVKESMRLYPAVWGISRVALADIEIGGYPIPPGASLVASQWVMHHHPRYFEDPYVFEPERWGSDTANQLPRFAYFPFGGGPRRCLGHAFAMLELVLILATVAQKVTLALVRGQRVEPYPSFPTLSPKYGLRMVVTRR